MQSIKYHQQQTKINMNRTDRIERIQEVVNREPFMIQEIPWQGKLEAMNV